MTREQASREDNKMARITERFGGKVLFMVKCIEWEKPIKIETRADALDILYLLTLYDDWNCQIYEPLEALTCFIKKLPKEKV